jgi:hypothetical protein
MSTTEPEPVEPEVVPEDEEVGEAEVVPIDYPGEGGDRGQDWQPDPDPDMTEAAPVVEEEEVGYEGER